MVGGADTYVMGMIGLVSVSMRMMSISIGSMNEMWTGLMIEFTRIYGWDIEPGGVNKCLQAGVDK